MGDPEADADNAVLSKEQEDQVRQSQRSSFPSTLNLYLSSGLDLTEPGHDAAMSFQIGSGSRGDVTILPTLVINNVQYRGWCCCIRVCLSCFDVNCDVQ